MRRRSLISMLVVTVVATVGLAVGYAARPRIAAAASAVKIMPLGDSLTGGPGCWRALLWTRLQRTGYTNIDFVGTQPGGGCNVASWDADNDGHGGALATGTADQNLLPGWLAATHPDIVMMNFGTNDIWNRRATSDIMAAFDKLVDQMRRDNPAMRILVAQIAPVAPPGCAECQQATIDLNTAIPGWAAAKTTTGSPITVVDHWTGWDPATDTTDGVHQSDAGNAKMADRWYPALTKALGGPAATTSASTASSPGSSGSGSTTSGSPGSTGSGSGSSGSGSGSGSSGSSAVTSTAPARPCAARYAVTSRWQGGFQAEVTVTAGQQPIAGWTVSWTLGAGQAVGQAWGATVLPSGAAVTATNLAWNGALGAAASTSFGLIGSGDAQAEAPAVTCTAS